MKNTKIPRWENAVLGIGFQFFNFFNHPNFGSPDNSSSDQRLGRFFTWKFPRLAFWGPVLGAMPHRGISN